MSDTPTITDNEYPVSQAENQLISSIKPFKITERLSRKNKIDLAVVEQLANSWMPEYAIAVHCGWRPEEFSRLKQKDEALQVALERGRANRSLVLDARIRKEIMEKGNAFGMLAMAAKQDAKRGGLGWMDERSLRLAGSIDVNVNITPAMEAFNKRRIEQDKIIDITPEEES